MKSPTKEVEREFLLAFWKLHILHHAGEEPVVGQWIIRELRRHGYEVSPGTLYPPLRGWRPAAGCLEDPGGGLRARKDYSLTREGRSVLELLRRHLEELYGEVVLGEEEDLPASVPAAPAGRKPGGKGPAPARSTPC